MYAVTDSLAGVKVGRH